MAFTLNRRLAQLVDSNGQLLTGKIPNDYISSDHIADNVITSAMLHTSFTVSASNLGTTLTPTFGNITTTGYIAGPATFTIDPAGVGDNTGTVVIAGNLQVDGTTTTINSTTMTVDDLNLTLASGAANAAAANGAGITVDGASATITYDGTNDEWDFNKDINVSGSIIANQAFTGFRHVAPDVMSGHTNRNEIKFNFVSDETRWYMVPLVDGSPNYGREFTFNYTTQQWSLEGSPTILASGLHGTPNINVGSITTDGLTTTGDINFGDSDKAIFGAGSDLQIYHDSSNSFIKETGTGDLRLLGSAKIDLRSNDDNTVMIRANAGGSVDLRHAGSNKLTTTSTGVNVTGTVTSNDITISDSSPIFIIQDTDGTNQLTKFINLNGNSYIGARNDTSDGNFIIGGYGANSFTEFARWNANGVLTQKLNLTVEGSSTFKDDIDVTGTVTSDGLTVNNSEVLFDNTGGDFTLKLNTNTVSDKNEIIMGDTGTPLAKFGVSGTANDIITGSDGQDFNIGTAGGGRAINFSTDNFGSVEMKLDGGNLLVGTTNTTLYSATSGGGIYAIPNGSTTIARQSTGSTQPLFILNETGLDGTLQEFRKDGAVIGSIATRDTGALEIGSGDVYLQFNGANDWIKPVDGSGGNKSGVDLGTTGAKFDNLYLSGTANVGGLTVDGTSNRSITIQAGTDSSASLRLKNDAQDWDINCQTNDRFAIYNQTNSTQPFTILPTSGNVGIGIDNPAEKLHIRDSSTDADVYIKIANDSRDWFMGVEGSNGDILSFKTHDLSNVLNITSSGNVGIGTTADIATSSSSSSTGFWLSSSDYLAVARNQQRAAIFNRIGNDGEVVAIRKDGSTVGSIGASVGDLTIYGTASGHSGFRFTSGGIAPVDNTGSLSADSVDIGQSSWKFRDIYLSGGVNFSANANASGMSSEVLDDYEEGSWTPSFSGATLSTATGFYTKIGDQVTVHYHVVTTGGLPSSTSQVRINDLPFSSAGNNVGAGSQYVTRYNVSNSSLGSIVQDSDNYIRFININTGSYDYTIWGELEVTSNNSITLIGTFTYRT